MSPIILLLIAAIGAAWVVLSILGGERQRRLNELEAERRVAAPSVEKTPAEAAGKMPAPLKPAG